MLDRNLITNGGYVSKFLINKMSKADNVTIAVKEFNTVQTTTTNKDTVEGTLVYFLGDYNQMKIKFEIEGRLHVNDFIEKFNSNYQLENEIVNFQDILKEGKYRILTDNDGFRIQCKGKFFGWNYVKGSYQGGGYGPVWWGRYEEAMEWIVKDIENKKNTKKTHAWKEVKL